MLKRLYQFCLERLAILERELFQESQERDDVLKLKGRKAFRELARAFFFLTAGIKYIFFQLLSALTELAVLVFLSPKDGYELLVLSHKDSHPEPIGEGSQDVGIFRGVYPEILRSAQSDSRRAQNDKARIYEAYERKHKKARWFSYASYI